MKKILLAAVFLTGFSYGFAQQAQEKKLDPNEDKDLMTWYHKDFATTKVYGINTQNAYKFLESKGLKPKTVIVGVLDSGVQIDHPGLVKNIWTNPNEVPGNGKDDDGNGYIDDVHGWNFIGGKNGDIDVDNMEVTRVVAKYKPVFEGDDSAKNKANQAKMPEEFAMYMKAKELFADKSMEAKQSLQTYTMINMLIPNMVKLLNGKAVTPETVAAIPAPTDQKDAIALNVLKQVAQSPDFKGKSSAEFEKSISEQMKEAIDHYEPQSKQYDLSYDPRKEIVGDNYDDYSERKYGNNHYEGPDAEHGTHVAGIIAGLPQGKEVQYGVASRVAKIMSVRTVPNGDERDKDVANAIRYAVDNGAKVLNMSFGKPLSPGKNVVWDAFKYAQDKGVLLVKAAGNENEDVAEHIAYPTNFKNATDEKPFVNNVLVVGASTNNNDALRASFSNYNKKMVNVFAPGEQIYSTVPKNEYRYLQGTSMASPVVAGAAAVLLAYMPELKPDQIIEALVKSSNPSTVNQFNDYSQAGGVIDLEKAAEYAYTHFYNGKSGSAKKATKPARKAVRK
ncbi:MULTISPECIES: S8 family serine peptidase [Chryseobacterium]|uniref:Cell wall-associated protease n=1 Tax=Chryseobacterium camelliae TaxID=1265445 RepID=A0ABU0TJC1_9FLAO|nr:MULTISPECIES: S8 family serine peptidase [Chryseobacterium]MDT3409008.1 cell wall-associated protease [Pseudacidovorax intermedius]MDQ1097134.1 cell wall-associated protease [Chryseobacterium camelliae]MDQ1101071.1 cell wall-associated protease [Chryseobacterium sp. SORGH_AS_1048]MDR6084514.1 cell wall-associated protease [Chryseobacterium sp. SORGH_AS_0909]MDR6132784.1 cell wall-associated protease [Chryseobacterium sp. SORGH_AS_1175]